MAQTPALLWPRLSQMGGRLLARCKQVCGRHARLWPWADRALVLLSISIVPIRSYGQTPFLIAASLAFPLFLLVIVFRSPPLTGPLPTLSGFIGMVFSYPTLAFLEFPSRVPSQIASGHGGIALLSAIAFYVIFLGWAFYSIGRSFAIFPAARKLVTQGPYRFVRHPIYASYLHLSLCFSVLTPSLHNLAVTAIFALGLFLRARCEEGLLSVSQDYGGFRSQVAARFFNPLLSAPVLAAAAVWFGQL